MVDFFLMPPIEKDNVFSKYDSFTFQIPVTSKGYFLGGSLNYALDEFKVFQHLIKLADIHQDHAIYGFYTRYIDKMGHKKYNNSQNKIGYFNNCIKTIFSLANNVSDNVFLISDHGCLNGIHTKNAYMGSNLPFSAKSILDIRKIIETYMEVSTNNLLHIPNIFEYYNPRIDK